MKLTSRKAAYWQAWKAARTATAMAVAVRRRISQCLAFASHKAPYWRVWKMVRTPTAMAMMMEVVTVAAPETAVVAAPIEVAVGAETEP